MSSQAPLVQTKQGHFDAVAQAADRTEAIAEAPFDGTVTSVSYTADAAVTGAATDNRTLSLINKGQSGSGSTVIATLVLASGVNLVAGDEKAITLSATLANRDVVAGDILAWASVHGGAGVADPGGLVQVEISRS